MLGTLAQVAAEGRVDLRGVVDRTQMDQVIYQWRTNGRSAWKIPILASVLEHADFRGKPSIPWTPETPHDFMHAKVTVADDSVFAGSFNLSRSGESNAENVLEVRDAELADRLAAYVDEVRERYERMPVPAGAPPTEPLAHLDRVVGHAEQVQVRRARSCPRPAAARASSRPARPSSRCPPGSPGSSRTLPVWISVSASNSSSSVPKPPGKTTKPLA